MAPVFYATTIGFILGIAVSSTFPVGVFGAAFFATLGAGFFGLWFLKRDLVYCVSLILFCAVSFGIARFEISERMFPTGLSEFTSSAVEIEGIVSREPDRREKTTHVYVEVAAVDGVPVRGTLLAFHDRHSNVRYGDRIVVTGELTLPEAFDTEYGRSFDYPGYLKVQGVSHTIFRPEIEIISSGESLRVIEVLLDAKRELSRSIESTLLAPESGLALGIVLGEKQSLGKELLAAFRDSGLIHIVVLSGYNIAIMIEALMRILAFLSVRVRALLGGVVILLFVLMVGPSATVLRAAVMAVLVLLARATNRTYAIMRALMVACVLMLIANPYLLRYDPGFQLSFLATLGLILVSPILEKYAKRTPNVAHIKEFALATVATQITVLPLLMYSMGAVSTVAVFANVLVLPLIPVAMLLSALVGAAGMLSSTIAQVLGYPASILLSYVILVSERLSSVPYASLPLPPFSFVLVILMYAAIALWIYRASLVRKGVKVVTTKSPPTIAKQSSGDPFPFS